MRHYKAPCRYFLNTNIMTACRRWGINSNMPRNQFGQARSGLSPVSRAFHDRVPSNWKEEESFQVYWHQGYTTMASRMQLYTLINVNMTLLFLPNERRREALRRKLPRVQNLRMRNFISLQIWLLFGYYRYRIFKTVAAFANFPYRRFVQIDLL